VNLGLARIDIMGSGQFSATNGRNFAMASGEAAMTSIAICTPLRLAASVAVLSSTPARSSSNSPAKASVTTECLS